MKEMCTMEKLENMENVFFSLDDGRIIDVNAGMDKLLAYAAEHKCEPGEKKTIDCPICGAHGAMAYTLSPYNGHLHAICSACRIRVIE